MNRLLNFFRSLFKPKAKTYDDGFADGVSTGLLKGKTEGKVLMLEAFLEAMKDHTLEAISDEKRKAYNVPSVVYAVTDTGLVIGKLTGIVFGPTNKLDEFNKNYLISARAFSRDTMVRNFRCFLSSGFPSNYRKFASFTFNVENLITGKVSTFDSVEVLNVHTFNALFQMTQIEMALLLKKRVIQNFFIPEKQDAIEALHRSGMMPQFIQQTLDAYKLDLSKSSEKFISVACRLCVCDQNDISAEPKYAIDYTPTDYEFLKGRLEFLKKKSPDREYIIDFVDFV